MNFDTDMTPYGAIESHMLLQWTSPALSETLTPEQSSFRESMLRWVCDDLFLSSFALLITKRPPPPPATSPAGLLSPISSARGTRSPSLSQRDSGQGSRLPTPTPSEASGLTEEPREDPAITLLRPFAESIDSITAKHGHRSRLLSHWPEEPGIDPAKYTWTLRDIVPRRRRRSKSWASDVRSVSREPGSSQPTIIVPVTTSMQPIAAPPSTSQSQGGSQNRSEDSSQPLSSQAMSQPVAGVFTPRHLKGKPKKKRVRGF